MPPKRKPKSPTATRKSIIKNIEHIESNNETELVDTKAQISELENLVRTLQIENATLKKKLESLKLLKSKSNRMSDASTLAKPRRNSTLEIKQKATAGCSCSGSCINKKCGCVKKDMACSEF